MIHLSRLLLCLAAGHGLAFVATAVAAEPGAAAITVLEQRRLHLGKTGQYEWDEFKDWPVDAEQLELRFNAKANSAEHTLVLWQREVKLSWPVTLNGRKLGTLTTSTSAQDTVLPIPAGALRDGENALLIAGPPVVDDIELGPVQWLAKPVNEALSGADVTVTVTDAATSQLLPCRLTLTRLDGTLQPLRATPAGDVAVRVGVVYTRDGKATLSVPPGDYILYAGRGFEWSVARIDLKLTAGPAAPVALALKREVPTQGWIATDSHIHTLTHSGHGDAKADERMLTIAGEGIELAISTEHNHHADYAPVAAATGVADQFTAIIGNEVTTKHGHFNAFPQKTGVTPVDHQQEEWATLLPAIRASGAEVITLNHPRDLHSGFVPLGGVQFNPVTGKHRQAAALDIDAMEVVTSAAMQSDIHLLFRDWFALLNRGHRIAAIGSSDSHDVSRFILGQSRTYVAAEDAVPARLDLAQVWRSYHEGRLLVSLGLLTKLRVHDQFEVGDLATGLPATVKVQATVFGPSWVTADHLALYANGRLLREETIAGGGRAGEKANVVWQLPKPAHDVHLVAIATGPGVTAPYWESPRPYQPSSKTFVPRVIGSTNPVWLDADGDGAFQSAFSYAQKLVQQHGNDAAGLKAALASYDETVAVQAASLVDATPAPAHR